jgi:hypothetical protein
MEEPLPVQESTSDPPQPVAMSLAARLLNVFAVPGEVFAGVMAGRFHLGNWLLPALLLAVVGILTANVKSSHPGIQRQIRAKLDQQAKTMEEQVKAGKLRQADVDRLQAVTRILSNPLISRTAGSIAAVIFGPALVFWWAFLLWLLGRRYLKVQVGYLKALEVAGLALMISVLGGIVMLLLVIDLPKLLAIPGAMLVFTDLETAQKSRLLGAVDLLFLAWLVGVLSVGLAKLAGVPFLRAAWFVIAVSVIQVSFLLFLGEAFGQFAF